MRIKVTPGDFRVEELLGVEPEPAGPWALYRLRKVNLTSLEARRRLAAALGLSPRQVVIPALKDKRAVTVQYAAARGGGRSQIAERVLGAEGFQRNDLKARILKKAYLTRSGRDLLLRPQDVRIGQEIPDVRHAGGYALSVQFALPPGCYASPVIKAAVVAPRRPSALAAPDGE